MVCDKRDAMIILGYLIFIWALAQASWMLIVKLNRTLNPEPVYIRYYELPLYISWKSLTRYVKARAREIRLIKKRQRMWRRQAEIDVMNALNALSQQAHDDLCAAEDAEVFAALKKN